MKKHLQLALVVVVIAACDSKPPLINEFVDTAPINDTQKWLDDVFVHVNPNVAEYKLITVNIRLLLKDSEQIRLRLLSGEIVTATRTSSKVYDGSIRWTGRIDGISDSHVKILATNNPYLNGHVAIGDRCEFFQNATPYADSIMFRQTMPQMSISTRADILPDADLADVDDVEWTCVVNSLPASAYRIVRLDAEVWRRKTEELEASGATTMRFFDDTEYRIVPTAHGRPRIEGDEFSSVGLHNFGGKAGLSGYVRSRQTGAVRVTKLDDSGLYVLWVMHAEFRMKID